MEERISIKDIARLAGVSIGTVDRVIHKRGRVSDETARRIQEIIRETGYAPDPLASRLRKTGDLYLGIIMPHPGQDSGYWELCLQGMRKAEDDARVFNLSLRNYFFDRYRKEDVSRAIGEALASDCAGFIVAPVLRDTFLKGLGADTTGRPLVFFDSDIPELPASARIGQDNLLSGALAGKLLCLLVPPDRPLAIINIAEDDLHIQQRVRGFLEYADEHRPGQELIRLDCPDSDSAQEARSRIEALCAGRDTVGGLFVPNATVHLYAEALEERLITRSGQAAGSRVPVVGYDSIPRNCAMVRRGTIDFLLSHRPLQQGEQAVRQLVRQLLLPHQAEESDSLSIDIITRENLPECPESGIHP